MHTGHYISGAGHLALVFWVLFGGVFRSEPDSVEVREVSVISEEEFAALSERTQPPESTQDIDAPPAPDSDPDPAPAPPAAEPPPEPQPEPEPAPEPAQETPPEAVPQAPPAEAQDEVQQPEPPAPDPEIEAPQISERPVPRPAPRVAPDPVPEPEPEAEPAPDVAEAVEPEPSEETVPEEPQEPEAPEAATSEIVTEAEEPSRAPTSSPRPRTRPNRPAPTQTAEPEPEAEPETETAAAPEPEAEPEPQEPAQEESLGTGVEDALAEALGGGGTTDPQPDVPTGPPMTSGERDAFRVAVQRCWVVDVGSQAANVTVVVGMDMAENGQVVANSIERLSASGGDGAAVETAFQAARRAILRCQGNGYDLPPEKYGQWDRIEITFDPSGMRIR
ncbi:cell envelope biogenesis protein TolA [Roseivivax sediminis]|uniref:Cell division and transport-associated protein TolA n=1 Tax=Roseivivax sediminis TaxID=936889 RepID=A0A1I1UY89_9RHOB|nr:cell envelope biogenesis protein TolA [Roseivivax sediminis]SFD73803.1 hypothetical protein SAMN04515678_102498 [Roseivivax sediminis]